MRARFQKFARGGRYLSAPVSSDIAPAPPDKKLAAAQRLNYDVLSIIFTLASTNWSEAALTLSSVCRLWRYTALSMSQMWSRIELSTSISPSNLRIILKCTKPLPLHIVIPYSASKKQLKVLAAATDRIVCMRIAGSLHFLWNQFPILERVCLNDIDRTNPDGLQCLSRASRFPKLTEVSMGIGSLPEPHQITWPPKFAGLQKLDISCWITAPCLKIVQGVSSTLVSLVMHVQNNVRVSLSFFSQLRHLRVTKSFGTNTLTLDLDAPQLECIERLFSDEGWFALDSSQIRLRNTRSVKQLRIKAHDFDLSAYPALRKLWIDRSPYFNGYMLRSLGRRIASCPELETISFYNQGGLAPEVFPAIADVIRKTGRAIAVREFLPDELDLPGDMRRSGECLRWPCHE